MNLKKYLEIASEAALEAGELLVNNFKPSRKKEFKSAHDLLSLMDKESEKVILKQIQRNFPDHSYFSEEFGENSKVSEFKWFVDPLDGTNNFVAGIPYFSVSIAMLYKGETAVGLVYNPVSKQMFTATKGGGSNLNNEPISPSSVNDLSKSTYSFIRGHVTYDNGILDKTSREIESVLTPFFRRTLTMWSPALDWSLVAAGGLEALVSFDSELEDQYAGTLIAQEAGVCVTSFDGKPYSHKVRRIIATNAELHKELVNLLSGYKS